jgi:hypothetical protein
MKTPTALLVAAAVLLGPLTGMAATHSDCLASEVCRAEGRCTFDASDQECVDDRVRRSLGMMVFGSTVAAAGGASVIAGATLCIVGAGVSTGYDDEIQVTTGLLFISVGVGVGLFVGVPLAVHGAGKVQESELAIVVGPESVAAQFRF